MWREDSRAAPVRQTKKVSGIFTMKLMKILKVSPQGGLTWQSRPTHASSAGH
jgi:hypothetical protein